MIVRYVFFVTSFLAVVFAPVLALASLSKPVDGELALVVAAPWAGPVSKVLDAAKMRDAHPARAPIGAFVVISTSSDITELYAHGALFVISGEEIYKLC